MKDPPSTQNISPFVEYPVRKIKIILVLRIQTNNFTTEYNRDTMELFRTRNEDVICNSFVYDRNKSVTFASKL